MDSELLNELKFGSLTKENLNAVYQMCERNVNFLSHSIQSFEKTTLHSDSFESGLSIVVYCSKGDVIAFFMAIVRRTFIFRRYRKVAVLKFFVVDKEWRNKGLGTLIYNRLLNQIKSSEKKCFRMKMEVMVSMPDYWLPGLDPRHTEAFFFLKKHGFKKGKERVNLRVDLDNISDNQPQGEAYDYKIFRASLANEKSLVPLQFMPIRYRFSFWPDEIGLSFRNEPITTFIAKNTKSKKIEGWASHSIHFPGSFGPTGVKKSARGKELGSLLLKWCLWDMKQMGLQKATILWVERETIYFYLRSIGAYIAEFYWNMKKRI